MPSAVWSDKRKRQYAHIKADAEKRGKSEPVAESIASRVVNKERAQHGESLTASNTSVHDMPAPRRGGLRSHKGPQGRTREQLYEEARKRGIKGRSGMTKMQLEQALKGR